MQIITFIIFCVSLWAVISPHVNDGIVVKVLLSVAAISAACYTTNPSLNAGLFCFCSLVFAALYWFNKELHLSVKGIHHEHANKRSRNRPY